jgi:excisionase family DNA binding protein
MMETAEPWVSTKEISAYLNKPASWIRDAGFKSDIPKVRVGRHWRYKKSEVELWLKNQYK